MPLEAPNLDTRTFADLKAEALLRIARYNQDWTDFNESDPGITLVELFAWFTELMLYQFNQIPDDSFASIQTQGLLGGKYIGISPGGSEKFLKDGGRIDQTQSAIVLESLINKFFAGYASKSEESKK